MPKESFADALDFAKFRSDQIKLFKAGRKQELSARKSWSGPTDGLSQTQINIRNRYQAMLADQVQNKKARKARAKTKDDDNAWYYLGHRLPLVISPTPENGFRRDTGAYRPGKRKVYNSSGERIG